jgi:hypothetical protein
MNRDVLDVLASGAFGGGAGWLAGLLGLGGGALLTPLFVFVLGIEQHRAQGISLAALLPPVGLPAVLQLRREGVRIQVRIVTSLVLGFVIGAAGGAWLAHRVDAHVLRWVFAAFLVVTAARTLLAALRHNPTTAIAEPPPGEPASWQRALLVAAPVGALAGVLSGVLGVGGGIVALPLLRRFAHLPRMEAQATTLAMMLPPIGLPAVVVYAREQGGLPWPMLAAVALCFAGGSWLGARVAMRIRGRTTEFISAALFAVLALLLLLRG